MKIADLDYKLDESLGHLATQFSRGILKRFNQERAKHGYTISPEQWAVLVYVWDRNAQPQFVLADRMFKDKATVARVVASTEALGLIKRVPGPTDGREKILYLTEQGKAVMEEITPIVQEVLHQASVGIDENELQICKDVLRRAHANVLAQLG